PLPASIPMLGGSRVRALLISYVDGEFAPLLAAHLRDCGFAVDALCPRSHILSFSSAVARHYTLGWRRSGTIRDVLGRVSPAVVIPCDDPARFALTKVHAACARKAHKTATLIERSIGCATHFALIEEKSTLLADLSNLGIRVPRTLSIAGSADL